MCVCVCVTYVQIQLADDSRLVWHAILLNSSELLISHEGSRHRVVVVSADDGEVGLTLFTLTVIPV